MKILSLHILTEKQLTTKIEAARAEQRKLNAAMMEVFAGDNVILSRAVREMKDKAKR